MKRALTMLLVFLLIVQLCAFTMPLSLAASAQTEPAISSNLGRQNYSTWSSVVRSYLYDSGENLIRVEAIGDNVTIETYTYDGKFVSGNLLQNELPLFGGFYCGPDSNFLVFGQNNPNESNDTEVIRVVRYDKSWKRLSAASLFGANTYIPFDAGSLRMEQYNGMLYVHTCHEMYKSNDGYHHQANVTFCVRLSDMKITDQFTDVLNSSYGYVSHSFNQFIHVDGQTLLTVCHGDAYPRSVVLLKYRNPAGNDTYTGYTTPIAVLPISGDIGQNYTGVSVGGFEITKTGYLIAGNSVDQKNFAASKQRNIFLTLTNRENYSAAGTSVIWLTNHKEGANVTVTTPQLVKVSDNLLAVLWTENGTLKYAFVDGSGNVIGKVYSSDTANLSDCQPILSGGKIIWYFTSNTVPQFCVLDPKQPESISVINNHSETEDKPDDGNNTCPGSRFRDVTATDWFYKAVDFAVSNNLFNGMTNDSFAPNIAMNRAMLVTVLWRYAGSPKEGTNTFSDVKAGLWYTDAVSWAAKYNIVGGVGGSKFDPNGNVTREQMAAILYRYCKDKGIDIGKSGDLSAFPDKAKVSTWATDACKWAVGEGLISGNKIDRTIMLDPQGNATRAQVATILMRFIKQVVVK